MKNRKKKPVSFRFRIIHRYLGYFLSGIMAMYAISGIVMIFRKTDYFKKEVITEKKLEPNLTVANFSSKLKKKIEKTENDLFYFKDGNYNKKTGIVTVKKMELPFVLKKMEDLHTSSTKEPLFFLNVFFGTGLLFFVFSAFWMYTPKMPVFKKGMYFAIAGAILTLILLFV